MFKQHIFVLFLVLILIGGTVESAIINVPDDQPTIQDGIYAAAQFDTVLVADGTYSGPGNRKIQITNQTVTVMSENGPESCIIDCDGTPADNGWGFSLGFGSNNASVIDGFTITDAFSYNYGAIIIGDSTTPRIKNCIITENGGDGIFVEWSHSGFSHPIVDSCIISNNTGHGVFAYGKILLWNSLVVQNGQDGFHHAYHAGVDIYRCTFAYNDGYGVNLFGDPPKGDEKNRADSGLVRESIAAFNGSYGMSRSFYLPATYFLCCNSYGNTAGEWQHIFDVEDPALYGNISADPEFCQAASGDFNIAASSPCAPGHSDCGLQMGYGSVGCTVTPQTWYVKADGSGDAATIQAAINLSNHGDTVLVAAGVYTGDGNRDIDFNGKIITVISEAGPYQTVINCEGSEGEPHFGFAIRNGEWDVTLSGFAINNVWKNDTGAIVIRNSYATVNNCIITNAIGSGIYCHNAFGPDSIKITNCVVANSSQYGILFYGVNGYVENCVVSGNEWDGIAQTWSGPMTVIGSQIYYNGWSGVTGFTMYDDFIVTGNTIVNNDVGINWWANYPKDGGEIKGDFRYNQFDVSDNIVAFNNRWGIFAEYDYNEETDSITRCNDVYGNADGDFEGLTNFAGDEYGNISEDPMFCDTTFIDYHIQYDSPCYPSNNSCGILIGALEANCGRLCGDLNNDHIINLFDIVVFIECVYGIGECPPDEYLDVNNDGDKNVLDITYLIAYLYQSGPAPECP